MLCYLAKNSLVTFDEDYPLGVLGKAGTIFMDFEADPNSPGYDEAVANALSNSLNAYQDSNNLRIAIVLVEEPNSLYQAILQVQQKDTDFITDMSNLLGRDNFRVKVAIAMTDAQPPADPIIMSSCEMMVADNPEKICQDSNVSFADERWFTAFCTRAQRIDCKVTVQLIINSPKLTSQLQPGNHLAMYQRLYENELGKDVTIKTANGGSVKCHKFILSACSPAFEAMFRTDMTESRSNEVLMDDMSELDVKAFLEYIYFKSLKWPDCDSSVCLELLLAADKYQVCLPMQKDMTTILMTKPADWWSVEVAKKLYDFAPEKEFESCVQLKRKAAQVLKQLSSYPDFQRN